MSFVPSKRLLWIVALVVVPAWLVLGMAGVADELLLLGGLLLVAIAALDAIRSMGQLTGLSVELPSLIRTSKGKSFVLTAKVTKNGAKLSQLRLGLPLPRQLIVESPEADVVLRGMANARQEWTVQALERGSYQISRCHIETPSRRGLWDMRGQVHCECEVRVYPDLSSERHLLAPLFMRKGTMGMHQVRQLGKGREFEQLRSYTPGDSYNDIYWKGTAKRRFPITMMHQVERTQEMHVIVDISRRSARPLDGRESTTQCERFLQAALVLALAAEQQGDRFGLTTFSDHVHTTLPASTGRSHYNACRDALYTLQPRIVSPDFNELFISIGNRLRHRSLLILLTDLGEPWLSESFIEATRQAARRHVVLVHVLGTKECQPLFNPRDSISHPDELYGRMAGHMMWSDLQETTRDLKQRGVHLTSSLQESLTARVVSEYLNVKKRQLL